MLVQISRSTWPVVKALRYWPILLLSTLACAFFPDEPTPIPTIISLPPNEAISYRVPDFRADLEPGQSIPGTGMTYLNKQGDIFNVSIDGLTVVRRSGDSFYWKGVLAPGVIAQYDLHVFPGNGESMVASGPVDLIILNPVPIELENPGIPANTRHHFQNIPGDYRVAKGAPIPGTTLVYEGLTEQGALFSGTTGYPYRALGDTLIWQGRLRGNVSVLYDLKVTSASPEELRVTGLSELWVTQARQ